MSNTVAVKQKNKTINKEGSFLNSLKEFFEVIWDNKMARIGFIILVIFLLMAIFALMFVSEPKSDYLARLKEPSAKHWLRIRLFFCKRLYYKWWYRKFKKSNEY